jgi:endonuclease/exonuclease/phosphatase family metal-dependent hydrolase
MKPKSDRLEPDPVIEAYKKDIDRTLLRENLKRTVAERLANLVALQELAEEARRAGERVDRPRD